MMASELIERAWKQNGIGSSVDLAARASVWFERVRQFRVEEMTILDDTAEEASLFHRACLAQLIADGELMHLHGIMSGFDPDLPCHLVGALNAELECLYASLNGLYFPTSHNRKYQVMEQAFGAH